jgi:hypothetical protein
MDKTQRGSSTRFGQLDSIEESENNRESSARRRDHSRSLLNKSGTHSQGILRDSRHDMHTAGDISEDIKRLFDRLDLVEARLAEKGRSSKTKENAQEKKIQRLEQDLATASSRIQNSVF